MEERQPGAGLQGGGQLLKIQKDFKAEDQMGFKAPAAPLGQSFKCSAPSCGYGAGDTVDDSPPFEEKPRSPPPPQMDPKVPTVRRT